MKQLMLIFLAVWAGSAQADDLDTDVFDTVRFLNDCIGHVTDQNAAAMAIDMECAGLAVRFCHSAHGGLTKNSCYRLVNASLKDAQVTALQALREIDPTEFARIDETLNQFANETLCEIEIELGVRRELVCEFHLTVGTWAIERAFARTGRQAAVDEGNLND